MSSQSLNPPSDGIPQFHSNRSSVSSLPSLSRSSTLASSLTTIHALDEEEDANENADLTISLDTQSPSLWPSRSSSLSAMVHRHSFSSQSCDSPASLLAADISENFCLALDVARPAPKRSLTQSFTLHASKNAEEHAPGPLSPISKYSLPHPSSKFLRQPLKPIYSSLSNIANAPSSRRFSKSSSFSRHSTSSLFSSLSHHNSRSSTIGEDELAEIFHSPKTTPVSGRKREINDIGSCSPSDGSPFSNSGSPINSFRRARPTLTINQPVADSSAGYKLNPAFKRSSKFRRTQSMFQHPQDLLSARKPTDLKQPAEPASFFQNSDTEYRHILPSEQKEGEPFRRITCETLIRVLDGHYKEHYDGVQIVDCRFEYEYAGGHIFGAINANSKEDVEKLLLRNPSGSKTLLVFHCEYSAWRAPLIARYLRELDREMNRHRYPYLHYPEIYVLLGGYSSFFKDHRHRCYPQKYVEMDHSSHTQACEREMHRFKSSMQLGRSQSYAAPSTNWFEGGDDENHNGHADHCSTTPIMARRRLRRGTGLL
ncbi:hypothetical protein CANCADRAFT_55441 [Tortispora caseinolytica NRRL Y-17796]|uniref:M-phase inducer phosphatase n=1 Tax=Tortispora caseinolytica NRRL Y-17796 TaxID=767744 RepID=A0A1E4TIP0_9ASCO|nr:hypothetical protein CANCADRAFT_55441 [Tortispora caseinolytica NRRL Y-17796]